MANCPVCNVAAGCCECSPAWLRESIRDLQRLLREAQERECPARDPNGECIAVNEAISEKEQAQEELLVAKRNADSWQETAQQAQAQRPSDD